MTKVCVAFSGKGSNLKRLIENSKKKYSRYHIPIVITDNPKSNGIGIAFQMGIPCIILPENQWDIHFYEFVKKNNIDLVVLAGFMKILPNLLCSLLSGKCINLHPSLLPLYKGLDTHRRVLLDMGKEHGCSVHYVSPIVDDGPIIAQAPVPVYASDTAEVLEERVRQKEHILLPSVVDAISKKNIRLKNNKVYFKNKVLTEPLLLEQL